MQLILPIEAKVEDLRKGEGEVDKAPKPDSKLLSHALKYDFLGKENSCPAVFNTSLIELDEKKP